MKWLRGLGWGNLWATVVFETVKINAVLSTNKDENWSIKTDGVS